MNKNTFSRYQIVLLSIGSGFLIQYIPGFTSQLNITDPNNDIGFWIEISLLIIFGYIFQKKCFYIPVTIFIGKVLYILFMSILIPNSELAVWSGFTIAFYGVLIMLSYIPMLFGSLCKWGKEKFIH